MMISSKYLLCFIDSAEEYGTDVFDIIDVFVRKQVSVKILCKLINTGLNCPNNLLLY
jgi:hypothetical protein